MPKWKYAFVVAGLIGATTILVAHPAGAGVCGCTSHRGVWSCYPSVLWCNDQCRSDYKFYSDRASCFKARAQSQRPAKKTSQTKKKPG